MGKIYKNLNPTPKVTPIPTSQPIISNNETISSQTHIIPLDQFEKILTQAENNLLQDHLSDALQDLLNLEISNFDNIRVHELLADLYLKQNNLVLAKEQCQICAHLIEKETPNNIFKLKTFEELLADTDSLENTEHAYQQIISEEINNSNFHQGTKILLNLATLRMAENRYQEAEEILISYRDKYLKFLDNDQNL